MLPQWTVENTGKTYTIHTSTEGAGIINAQAEASAASVSAAQGSEFRITSSAEGGRYT